MVAQCFLGGFYYLTDDRLWLSPPPYGSAPRLSLTSGPVQPADF